MSKLLLQYSSINNTKGNIPASAHAQSGTEFTLSALRYAATICEGDYVACGSAELDISDLLLEAVNEIERLRERPASAPARPEDYTLSDADILELEAAIYQRMNFIDGIVESFKLNPLLLETSFPETYKARRARLSNLRQKLLRGFETVIRDVQP
jgi:hypothetical protein